MSALIARLIALCALGALLDCYLEDARLRLLVGLLCAGALLGLLEALPL